MWMSQYYFSLGFLSQYSLWKLSIFHGDEGYLYWSENGMRRVRFFKIELAGSLAWWLDWVASSSHEQTELPDWTFCPAVLQLAWLFIFSACFTRMHHLAAYQPRVPTTLHKLEHFFTLSHTLPLHDSHLNIGLLIAKLQANLAQNKVNKMVDWIQPYNPFLLHHLFRIRKICMG